MRRLLGAVLLASILLGACGGDEPKEKAQEKRKPTVVTAFYPLQFVVERVAGGKAKITSLTPAGVEPHDLELTPSQVASVKSADLFVYLGHGFQPAVEAALPGRTGRNIDGLEVAEQTGTDPHVWLDPVLMEQITKQVAIVLGELDPKNKATFVENSEELVGELRVLDDAYQNGLTLCQRRDLVTSHEAFGYLARRFNLNQIGISGIDPEQEPSGRRLREVTDLVRKRGVTTIFFEDLLPPDIAETVAREAKVKTARLNPIESKPEGGDYLSAMRSNLNALREALGCR